MICGRLSWRHGKTSDPIENMPTTNWAESETTEYERPERKQIRVTAGEAEGLVTLNVSKAGPYLLQKSESADFCVFGKEIVIKCC